MSSDFAPSTVSYTSISSNDPSWGIPAMDPYKEVAHQGKVSLLLSPEYVLGPEQPLLPNYVPGPKHPPSPDYVPGPEYPEYLIPYDDEVLIEDQSLPADASTTTLSPGYVADSNLEEDPADYPIDGGYEEEEFYGDDADDEDGEEASKEEEEHLASANSSTIPIDDPTHMEAATEALIAAVAAALPSSSPPDSPLTPLSSPLPQIPSPPLPLPTPPSPLLLPATDRGEDVPEADLPLQKRLCLTTPAPSFVDTMDATLGRPRSREVSYRIMDVWDYMVRDMKERAPTTLKDLS
ncbi:hypothetical protein Tco_0686114 [Tanacetum coccineum]